MSSKNLRVVHVGCGGMSGAWLEAVAAEPHAEVVGLVDLNAEAARERAAEFGLTGARVSDELEEALRSTRPDIVFNCTVPAAHKPVTLAALEAGCHVLSEKPLAENLEDAREMIRAARAAGRLFAVVQNRRYDCGIRTVRATLEAGLIGTVHTVNTDFYVGPHFGGFRDSMEHVLLLDMAIHTFDQARYAVEADAERVYCREFNPVGSWYQGAASAMAIFELGGGIVFNYRGSWCAEGLPTSWQGRWRLIGDKGTLTWEDEDIRLEVAVGDDEAWMREVQALPPAWVDWPEEDCGHRGVIGEFLDCVRHGREPLTHAADNFKSLAMVHGAIASAEAGRPVAVPKLED